MKRKMINDTVNDGIKEQNNASILDVSGCDLSSAATANNNSSYFADFFQQHCNANNGIDLLNIETLNISRCRLGPVGIANLFAYLSTPITSSFATQNRTYAHLSIAIINTTVCLIYNAVWPLLFRYYVLASIFRL